MEHLIDGDIWAGNARVFDEQNRPAEGISAGKTPAAKLDRNKLDQIRAVLNMDHMSALQMVLRIDHILRQS